MSAMLRMIWARQALETECGRSSQPGAYIESHKDSVYELRLGITLSGCESDVHHEPVMSGNGGQSVRQGPTRQTRKGRQRARIRLRARGMPACFGRLSIRMRACPWGGPSCFLDCASPPAIAPRLWS